MVNYDWKKFKKPGMSYMTLNLQYFTKEAELKKVKLQETSWWWDQDCQLLEYKAAMATTQTRAAGRQLDDKYWWNKRDERKFGAESF
jgi:hypothetical protein